MTTLRQTRSTLALLAVPALLAACETVPATDTASATTDQFVRSALDAYSVISVAPSVGAHATTAAPGPRLTVGSPLSATRPALTFAEVCEGRSGVQEGYVSSRTGQPIDCGPSSLAPSA